MWCDVGHWTIHGSVFIDEITTFFMPRKCKKCGEIFPFCMRMNGKPRNFGNRRFCLKCSPFGSHNTRDLTKPKGRQPRKEPPFKVCNKYKKRFSSIHFYRRYAKCKRCTNKEKLRRDIKLKEKAIAYKGGKCERCGYKGHYAPFDFHHVGEKNMVWNEMRNTGWDRVRLELDGCELLCSNCHRIHHAKGPVA